MKPLAGTFAENVLAHGCGALNIDGARVAGEDTTTRHNSSSYMTGKIGEVQPVQASYVTGSPIGRFPANLILDEASGAALDATQPGAGPGPSRFFYCAKAGTKERNAGLDTFDTRQATGGGGGVGDYLSDVNSASGKFGSEKAPAKNAHPTLKPIALTTYLATLLLPPPRVDGKPRRLLVPFSGAGSEMIGALLAGWDEVVGIEIDPSFVEIAKARIAHHTAAVDADSVEPAGEELDEVAA